MEICFFYSLPKRKKNTPKKGQHFSFFEIFTTESSHFFVTKKHFFVTKKSLNSAVKISKNEKSCPPFWGIFSPFGERIKKNSTYTIHQWNKENLPSGALFDRTNVTEQEKF